LLEQLRRDADALHQGLVDDGVALPAPPAVPAQASIAAALVYAERLALHVAQARHPESGEPLLDGLRLGLAPRAVRSPEAFARTIAAIAALPPTPEPSKLRVEVFAPTVPALADLLPRAARFELDHDELFDFLEQLGPPATQGPADERAPKLAPEQRARIEAELGQPIVSIDTGRALKSLVMRGSRALARGEHREALRKLRAARVLCEATGLRTEAVLIGLGVGTAYVATRNLRAARVQYATCRARALELERTDLAAQADFALGQLWLNEARYDEARPCFERIVAALDPASPLAVEAKRLAEACKRRENPYASQPSGVRA
jgi:tetratricopeptide (TPR) repeat protein